VKHFQVIPGLFCHQEEQNSLSDTSNYELTEPVIYKKRSKKSSQEKNFPECLAPI